jgi:uncharacterized protein YndB with AHSA1/START domain
VALVLLVVVIGYTLPQNHIATREITVAAPPAQVFALIATPSDYPKWRSDVDSVEVLPPEGGKDRFREIGSNGPLLMRVQEKVADSRMVMMIADTTLPFGGKWIYELAPSGSGTRLRITEDGEVYNPLFRFMSRFVFGHTATMEKYLSDVEKEFQGPGKGIQAR